MLSRHQAWKITLSCLICLVLLTSAWTAPPAGYYDSAMGLSGNALRRALHNIIKNHTVLPYSSSSTTDTRLALKILDEDPNNTDNVLLHYKGTSVAKADFGITWNSEHLWPQSLGADVLPPQTDLHHLFAEDPSLNSSRSNSVFDNVYPNHTNSGYGNYWTSTRFEVRDPQKGDVARALFYMDVRYEGTGGENDFVLTNTLTPSYGQMGVLSTLLQWHVFDPPDAREEQRNNLTYSLFQNNRNPFVDHPEFVYLIWGPVTDNDSLVVNYTNRATATVGAGSTNYPLLSLDLATTSGEWDLQSLALSNVGSLGDAYISAIRLYRDMDNSGTVSSGDILLGTSTFSSGNATLACDDPSRVTTNTVHFLLAADLVSTAPTGQTLQIRIDGLTHASTGGNDIDPTFSPFSSSAATVSGGVSDGDTVSISFTDRSPASVSPGAVNVPFVTVTMAAHTNEWDLASFSINQAGTVPAEKIVAVKLYLDADNDAIVDAGDGLLDMRTFSGGSATFTLSPPLRVTTSPVNLLITLDFASVMTNGQTVGVEVVGTSFVSSVSGGIDVNPTVSNFSSGTAAVTGGLTDGDTITVTSTNLAPTTAALGASNVPLLRVTLQASGNEWDLGTVSVSRLGNAQDSAISAVKLYLDEDGDNVIDVEDPLLDSRALSSGAATLQIGGAVRVTPTSVNLILAADLAANSPSGRMFGLKINANGITHAPTGGNDVDPTFSDQSSSLLAIINAALPQVKIAMVSTRGSDGVASKEFIVLANQSYTTVSLANWQLRSRAGSSTSDAPPIPLSGQIPPRSQFLIASQAYGAICEGKTVDFSDTNTNGLFGGMSDTTGRSIALFDGTASTANKIDGFSFLGGATNDSNYYREGTAFTGSNGSSSLSFARKTLPSGQEYVDTDNNLSDLQMVSSKSPFNTSDWCPVTISGFHVE